MSTTKDRKTDRQTYRTDKNTHQPSQFHACQSLSPTTLFIYTRSQTSKPHDKCTITDCTNRNKHGSMPRLAMTQRHAVTCTGRRAVSLHGCRPSLPPFFFFFTELHEHMRTSDRTRAETDARWILLKAQFLNDKKRREKQK